jgi:hypothetical protein
MSANGRSCHNVYLCHLVIFATSGEDNRFTLLLHFILDTLINLEFLQNLPGTCGNLCDRLKSIKSW